MNVEIGAEAALFPEKEYINGIAVAMYYGSILKDQVALWSITPDQVTHELKCLARGPVWFVGMG
jgi:hypothetical protein